MKTGVISQSGFIPANPLYSPFGTLVSKRVSPGKIPNTRVWAAFLRREWGLAFFPEAAKQALAVSRETKRDLLVLEI
jgi:hypothetical protein